MTEKVLVFNAQNNVADEIAIIYTSPSSGAGTRITAFTASNDTTSSKTYKAYIYSATSSLEKSVIPQTIVVRDRADYGASIVNQVIPAGGTLRVESSEENSINFYVTGIEQ